MLAASSYDPSVTANAAYLINAATGQLLATLNTLNDTAFPQPVFADGLLLLGTSTKGVFAYRPAH